jgi:RHS repeat-associated protein
LGIDLSGSLQGAGGVGGLLLAEVSDGIGTMARHFHYDGNGNVTEVTDLAGNNLARYRYDAFGNTLVATGTHATANKYRFSTKPLDNEIPNAQLYYYGYRYYDPTTGRWPSRDPIGERGGMNLYGFVGNDGTNRWDLLGQLDSGEFQNNGVPNVVVSAVRLSPLFCGKYIARFQIELDRPAPSHGYIIQEITVTRSSKPCGEGPERVTVERFFEAFYISAGESRPNATRNTRDSDDHWAQSLKCTKGSEETVGTLKFMPFKMTGDLGENGISGGWKTGNEGGHPWSNDLPSSLEPPNGWVGTDAVEQNSLRATWDCCDGDKLTELQTEF